MVLTLLPFFVDWFSVLEGNPIKMKKKWKYENEKYVIGARLLAYKRGDARKKTETCASALLNEQPL